MIVIMTLLTALVGSCVLRAVAGRLWTKGWNIPALLGRFRAWWRSLAFGPFFWLMVLVKSITTTNALMGAPV